MYVAKRPIKADGKTYEPGDTVPADGWMTRRALLRLGWIVERAAPSNDDSELESLRAEAKDLGIKGYGNMKKETLIAKIAEIKELQDDPNVTLNAGNPTTPSTGGDQSNVDILGGSNQQPEGQTAV